MSSAFCQRCGQTVAAVLIPGTNRAACPLCRGELVGAAFDPYHVWLGIPPHEQPPHHYRLLGITLFEPNPEVIEHAADRQVRHLRDCATGPRAAAGQSVLNAVMAARNCLLDPARRQAYDIQLRARFAAVQPYAAPQYQAPQQYPASQPYQSPQPYQASQQGWQAPYQQPSYPQGAVPGGTYPHAQNPMAGAAPMSGAQAPRAPAAPQLPMAPRPRMRVSQRPNRSVGGELIKVILGGAAGILIGYLVLQRYFPEVIERLHASRDAAKGKASAKTVEDPSKSPSRETNDGNSGASGSAGNARSGAPATSGRRSSKSSGSELGDDPEGNSSSSSTDDPDDGSKSGKGMDSDKRNPSGPGTAMENSSPKGPSMSLADLANPQGQQSGADGTSVKGAWLMLPPLESTAWAGIGTLPVEPTEISVKADFERDDGRLQVRTVDGESSHNWNVLFRWSPKMGEPSQDIIAKMRFDEPSRELQFQWGTAHAVASPCLENCVLSFKGGIVERQYLLRQPDVVPAVKIDFTQQRLSYPVEVGFQPANSQIFLEIPSLEAIPVPAHFPKENRVALGREIVVEFSELPGAELAFKLVRASAGNLNLLIESRFRENPTRKFDMTLEQLGKAERNIGEALREAQTKLGQYEANVMTAQRRLEELREQTPRNVAHAAMINREMNALTGAIQENTRRARLAEEQVEEAQARLENAPKIRALLEKVQGSAFPYLVTTEREGNEFTLLNASRS